MFKRIENQFKKGFDHFFRFALIQTEFIEQQCNETGFCQRRAVCSQYRSGRLSACSQICGAGALLRGSALEMLTYGNMLRFRRSVFLPERALATFCEQVLKLS